MPRIAVYAGTFDPVTCGHEDLINRASKMFDQVIVAIGVNSAKKPLFALEERIDLLQRSLRRWHRDNIEVTSFEGLLVNFCVERKAEVIVRGLRAAMEFDYELGIAHANLTQEKGIDTIFLPTKPEFSFVSSSVVKELAKHGGDVHQYVSNSVEKALWEKFRKGPSPEERA